MSWATGYAHLVGLARMVIPQCTPVCSCGRWVRNQLGSSALEPDGR
jgi:hypothetical protein